MMIPSRTQARRSPSSQPSRSCNMRSPNSSRTIRARGGGATSQPVPHRRSAILRRNGDPSVATLLIAGLLVVTVAARPGLALRSDGSAGDPADDGADCSPAPAAQYPANDPPQ